MLLFLKFVYLIIIAVICCVGGLAPILFKRFGQNALSFSNCIGGGILFGASLIHLLKDSQELLLEAEFNFPVSNLFCAIGFFLSFILERVLFEHHHDHTIPIETTSKQDKDYHKLKTLSIQIGNEEIHNLTRGDNSNSHLIIQDGEEDTMINLITTSNDDNDIDLKSKDFNIDDEKHQHQHQHHHDDNETNKNEKKKFPFMLFTVLSLESFISGSALGIEDNEISIFVTFFAIVTHIWAESFTLTAAIMKTNQTLKTIYISAFVFSMVTPIGGIFGLISEYLLSKSQSNFVSGILLALASGCFLYVAIFEVLAEEFNGSGNDHGHGHNNQHNNSDDDDEDDIEDEDQDNNIGHTHNHNHKSIFSLKWIKLILVLFGFTFMSVLGIFV